MKTFVIGDIHGGLRALTQVLDRAQVTLNDQLIFLGDYVDGWSEYQGEFISMRSRAMMRSRRSR